MPNERLCGAGVEDIHDAGFQHLVESNGVMPAIMENLDDILVDHGVPEHFPGEPEGLEVAQLIHLPDVEEEGVPAVVQLHHLDEAAPPKTALEVHAQDRTVEDVRRATVQGLVIEDIVGLSLYEGLAFLERR